MNITYVQVFMSAIPFFHARYQNLSFFNLSQDIKKCEGNFTLSDALGVVIFVIVFAKSRKLSQSYVFMPLCEYLRSDTRRRTKVCESGWKAMFHTIATFTAAIIIFRTNCKVCFHDTNTLWNDYSYRSSVSLDIRLHYLMELGYYFYGLYAVVFIETRKKDSSLLLLHHIVTILLLFGSYYLRFHKFGPIITFLHDFNDIFLEWAKFFFHIREQGGKVNVIFKRNTELCGVLVPITWFITRIYYYPLTGLYGSLISPTFATVTPLALLCWIIFAMDLFWFTWIVLTYYRVIIGKMKEISDVSDATSYDSNKSD